MGRERRKERQPRLFMASLKFNYTIWPITNHFWVSFWWHTRPWYKVREGEHQPNAMHKQRRKRAQQEHKATRFRERTARKHWKKFTHLSFFMFSRLTTNDTHTHTHHHRSQKSDFYRFKIRIKKKIRKHNVNVSTHSQWGNWRTTWNQCKLKQSTK